MGCGASVGEQHGSSETLSLMMRADIDEFDPMSSEKTASSSKTACSSSRARLYTALRHAKKVTEDEDTLVSREVSKKSLHASLSKPTLLESLSPDEFSAIRRLRNCSTAEISQDSNSSTKGSSFNPSTETLSPSGQSSFSTFSSSQRSESAAAKRKNRNARAFTSSIQSFRDLCKAECDRAHANAQQSANARGFVKGNKQKSEGSLVLPSWGWEEESNSRCLPLSPLYAKRFGSRAWKETFVNSQISDKIGPLKKADRCSSLPRLEDSSKASKQMLGPRCTLKSNPEWKLENLRTSESGTNFRTSERGIKYFSSNSSTCSTKD